MKQCIFTINSNVKIADNIYKMILEGDTSSVTAPGQFINVKIDNLFLRRPISICDYNDSTVTIIYKVVGEGTKIMSKMGNGQNLDVLISLGNGYNINKSGINPILIGGGVGVPPLYNLCKQLIKKGCKVSVVIGFNNSSDAFYEEEFKELGANVFVTTVDGSQGTQGFVTDVVKNIDYTFFYACGPEAMLKAVDSVAKTGGELSFEERMGCGFGACMGCTCKTKYDNKRICKDGPVLEREEIIW